MGEPLFDKNLDEPMTTKIGATPKSNPRLRAELEPGERLVWVGQPRPGLFARQAWPFAVFGAVCTAFASHGLVTSLRGQAEGDGIAVWAVPLLFVLIGLATLSSPWWTRLYAKRTL